MILFKKKNGTEFLWLCFFSSIWFCFVYLVVWFFYSIHFYCIKFSFSSFQCNPLFFIMHYFLLHKRFFKFGCTTFLFLRQVYLVETAGIDYISKQICIYLWFVVCFRFLKSHNMGSIDDLGQSYTASGKCGVVQYCTMLSWIHFYLLNCFTVELQSCFSIALVKEISEPFLFQGILLCHFYYYSSKLIMHFCIFKHYI